MVTEIPDATTSEIMKPNVNSINVQSASLAVIYFGTKKPYIGDTSNRVSLKITHTHTTTHLISLIT
jgi:hypothetical protein